jgi:uncharacterized protein YkwD
MEILKRNGGIRVLNPAPSLYSRTSSLSAVCVALCAAAGLSAPAAYADNTRFNNSVVSNVYTVQRQAGCTNELRGTQQLRLAAQRHAQDMLRNRELDGDTGSDGSTPQDRADAAGYVGAVAETVAINPALAMSGIELINRWYHHPAHYATMSDCGNTEMGVWSENSLDRTVVVAVYGRPR